MEKNPILEPIYSLHPPTPSLLITTMDTSRSPSMHTTLVPPRKSTYVTNFFEVRKQMKNGTYNNMTKAEMVEANIWSFERVQAKLIEMGKIDDPDWLNNHLRPQIKRLFTHLLRSTGAYFYKGSQMYELWAIDLMLDADLNVRLIECNAYPGMKPDSEFAKGLFTEVNKGILKITTGLLRSRVKRILDLINNLSNEQVAAVLENSEAKSFRKNTQQLREETIQEYKRAEANRLDPEYEPKNLHGFELFMDENLEGTEKYMGLLSEDCL